jgi:hypothetical protein
MTTTLRDSVVVGTFTDDRQALKTLDELREVGFGHNQTGFAFDAGELVIQADELARADVADFGLVGALMGMGVPQEDARSYEREFVACRAVVTVQSQDRLAEAARVLRRNHANAVHRW